MSTIQYNIYLFIKVDQSAVHSIKKYKNLFCSFCSFIILQERCCVHRQGHIQVGCMNKSLPLFVLFIHLFRAVKTCLHFFLSALQIFKSELHPSVFKLQSGEKEGLSLYGKTYSFYHHLQLIKSCYVLVQGFSNWRGKGSGKRSVAKTV